MRTRQSICTLLIACVLSVGNGASTLAQGDGSGDTNSRGSLTLEVTELVAMEGLELAGEIWNGPGPVFHIPIDRPVFAASDRVPLEPGHHYVWVFVGEPPCEAGFIPSCGPNQEPAAYFCWFDLDVLAGDDLVIALAGLPELDIQGDTANACPITKVIHLAEPPEETGDDS